MIAGLLAALAALPPCPPLPGAEVLFARPETKVVWVGETHGSAEQPALFGDLVCAAGATGRPVVVVLERGRDEQPAWDAFLRSDGGAAARAALMNGPLWSGSVQDGRSSVAMLALAERLRGYVREGRVRTVRAMVSDAPTVGREGYEAALAATTAAATVAPNGLVLAYSGSAHARKGPQTIGDETYREAALQLPAASTLSVKLEGAAGGYWNCQRDGCGVHPSRGGPVHARGVVVGGAPEGFDAVAYTGLPATASPPAGAPAEHVPLPGPVPAGSATPASGRAPG